MKIIYHLKYPFSVHSCSEQLEFIYVHKMSLGLCHSDIFLTYKLTINENWFNPSLNCPQAICDSSYQAKQSQTTVSPSYPHVLLRTSLFEIREPWSTSPQKNAWCLSVASLSEFSWFYLPKLVNYTGYFTGSPLAWQIKPKYACFSCKVVPHQL